MGRFASGARLKTFFLLKLLFFRFHGHGFALASITQASHLSAISSHGLRARLPGCLTPSGLHPDRTVPAPLAPWPRVSISNPDCPVSFMFPVDWIFTLQVLSGEKDGFKDTPCERDNLLSFYLFGIFRFRKIHTGGHKVNQVCRLVLKLSSQFRRDSLRPMSDQWCADSPLMYPVLVFAERCVAHICPCFAVSMVGVITAGHYFRSLFYHHAVTGRWVSCPFADRSFIGLKISQDHCPYIVCLPFFPFPQRITRCRQ